MSSPESSSSESPGGNGRWEPPTPAELQALMPGYTIEKLLGRGGMGAVYKGVQENLDRTVAIKILPPGVEKEDPSFAERFKNEARLMAKLMHSSVVGVFDFGSTSAGQLYIVMEYVDGTDVSQMIRSQKKLPPEHALAITAHVCDALAAAHELGIVHRDIKPANVLINMKGQVKVADFGLAKIDDPGSHGLTKTGYAMGTPDFVAPEALMLGTAVDGRADLYAVGVMLYQMLTGQIPRGAWQPASVLSPGTDPRFDQIILKAMQYDREARYQSSTELRQALDIILTVPLVKQDAPAAAVVPAAEVAQVPAQRSAAQKPVAKGPQPRSTTDNPVRREAAPADRSVRATSQASKSNTPLFIGLAAAAIIAIGAFFMFSGKSEVARLSKVESAPPPTTTPASATTSMPKGEWIRIKLSQPDLADSGATLTTAGKLKPSRTVVLLPGINATDVAIRARLNRSKEATGSYLIARLNDKASRTMQFFPDSTAIQTATNEGHRGGINAIPHDPLLGITNPVLLEMAVIGDNTYGAVDGVKIGPHRQQLPADGGGVALSGLGSEFSDIEIMLLDGVSEDKWPEFVKTAQKNVASSPPKVAVVPTPAATPKTSPAASALSPTAPLQTNNAPVALTAAATAPSLPVSSSPSLPPFPPELTALDDQLKKLTAERVTAVFDADVAKLNSGYLGGLDRKIAEEKAAGHLDGVLALNAEKTLIQGVGVANSPASDRDLASPAPCPLPADDDKTTTVLKGLRAIYRDAYAKIEAAHTANLKALTDPLAVRLQQLEADLTKKDRIADAQTVRGYREKLGGRADGPPSAAVTPQTALGGPSALPTTSVIALKDGFTNSLGMKFVPVPGTDVVMCIHETRRQDYAAFAADASGVSGTWKNVLNQGLPVGNEDNHPVAAVSWDDAKAFCEWLSQKEGRAYRLPTDQEWSYAVGIGRQEKGIKNTTPELLSQQVKNHWPWGDNFPPKTKDKAGNYADTTRKEKFPAFPAFESYTDGYVSTAPVMSFTPNKIGIYDLGGNQFEWVEDWFNAAQMERTQRGASFVESSNFGLLSSYRGHSAANSQHPCNGFRVVVDLKAPTSKPAATPAAQTLTPTKPSGLSPFPLPVPKRPTEAGKLVMWRLDGQPMDAAPEMTAFPAQLTDVVDVALGWGAAFAVRADGSVAAWGKPDHILLTKAPANLTDVVDMSVLGNNAATLSSQGTLAFWGNGFIDEPMPDVTPAVAVDVKGGSVLALRNDGKVFQWGRAEEIAKWNIAMPAGLDHVIALSNASNWNCALREDGSIVTWGKKDERESFGTPLAEHLPKPREDAVRIHGLYGSPYGYVIDHDGSVTEFGSPTFKTYSLENARPKIRGLNKPYSENGRLVFMDDKKKWHFIGTIAASANGVSAMNVPYCEKMSQDAIQIVFNQTYALAIKPKDAKEPK